MDNEPQVYWRILLSGEEADLRDLATCFARGDIRISNEGNCHFLESDHLNNCRSDAEAGEHALRLLDVVSSVARVRRSVAKRIRIGAIERKETGGIWRRSLRAAVTITIYGSAVYLPSGIFERSIDLVMRDEVVRSILVDFSEEWDHPRLRRVGEAILLDIGAGDSARGLREVVKRGWASAADCDLFRDSVNFGDQRDQGAHSRLRRTPGNGAMNVVEAGEFLRGLVAKWIESKA